LPGALEIARVELGQGSGKQQLAAAGGVAAKD
jgi:hypothetical protein